jgi:hypothetical protein
MSTDVVAELADLASAVAWVEPGDDLAVEVRRRLVPARPRRRLALVAGAVGVVLGVGLSPVGSAVAGLFRVDGVEVKVVDQLPDAADGPDLGRRTTLAEARAAVDLPVRLPADLGRPDEVYVGSPPGGVTLVWHEPEVLVTQHPGSLAGVVKTVVESSRARPVPVDGTAGLWLTGPHVVTYTTPDGHAVAEAPRRAGNTLVWSTGPTLIRIEVDGPLADALAVAASLS